MFNLTIYRFKINLLLYIEAQINYLRQLSAHSVNFIHISDDISLFLIENTISDEFGQISTRSIKHTMSLSFI